MQIMIDLPDEVLVDTHMTRAEAAAFAKKMAALGYDFHHHVSIGWCAEIAGISEEEFMVFLGENHIDVFCFDDDEELIRDVSNA